MQSSKDIFIAVCFEQIVSFVETLESHASRLLVLFLLGRL